MNRPKITTVHHRTIAGVIDSAQLERLAAIAVLREAGEREALTGRRGVIYEVRFEDETAGSPPFKVGTRAIVKITEDMAPQADEEASTT